MHSQMPNHELNQVVNEQLREIMALRQRVYSLLDINANLEQRLKYYESQCNESTWNEGRQPLEHIHNSKLDVKRRKPSPAIPEPVTVGDKSCRSCHSIHPNGYWVKDHDHPNGLLCQFCYGLQYPKHSDLLLDCSPPYCEKCQRFNPDCISCCQRHEKFTQRDCHHCHLASYGGIYYKDPSLPSKRLCLKCYMTRAKCRIDALSDGTLVQRTCISCCASKSTSWYRDNQNKGAYICKQCYNHRYQLKLEVLPDGTVQPRVCAICQVTQSPVWAKDLRRPGIFLCKRCHNAGDMNQTLLNSEIKIPNRSCTTCATESSTRWYKDQRMNGGYVCVRCYNKAS
jgi:hypothetical protein